MLGQRPTDVVKAAVAVHGSRCSSRSRSFAASGEGLYLLTAHAYWHVKIVVFCKGSAASPDTNRGVVWSQHLALRSQCLPACTCDVGSGGRAQQLQLGAWKIMLQLPRIAGPAEALRLSLLPPFSLQPPPLQSVHPSPSICSSLPLGLHPLTLQYAPPCSPVT